VLPVMSTRYPRRRNAVDGTASLFILLLTVIPVVLVALIALPLLASRSTARPPADAQAADRDLRSPRPLEQTPPGRADRAA
jgi:hypothetical protein